MIKNFIDADLARTLASGFKDFCDANDVGGDPQVPLSKSHYNWLPFVQQLVHKTAELSDLSGQNLLPTYTYARIYQNGSDLKPHIDRPSCEISVTVNLGGDQPWPISIRRPDGSEATVVMDSGDAMLYLGCRAEHWRQEFQGQQCVQLFMHYVDMEGSFKDHFFDKKMLRGKQLQDEIPDTLIYDDVLDDQVLESFVDDVIEPVEVDLADMPDALTDYIQVIENIIPNEVCDAIINEYQNEELWKKALIGGGAVAPKIRNVNVLTIDSMNVLNQRPSVRNKLISDLDESMFFALQRYHQKVPSLHHTLSGFNGRSSFDLLRYNQGDFYREHTDFGAGQHRVLSVSFCLNDDYEGGEFGFFNARHRVKPPRGSILIFPSNFMYPHEVLPVTRGTRWSVITWLGDNLQKMP